MACWAAKSRSTVCSVLVAFACGTIWLQTAESLPRHPLAILFAACAAATVARRIAPRRSRWLGLMVICVLALVAGYAYAAWRAETRLADELSTAWEGESLRIVGVVDDLPTWTDRGARFAFAVERAEMANVHVPARISLAWYAPGHDDDPDADVPALHAGERWALTVRLQRPHGNVNPGGFDLEAWLLQQGFRATGYVRDDTANRRIDAFAGRWRDHVQRSREAVRARVGRALEGAPYAGVITALAIGDQGSIASAQWTIFNRTGIGHLVSISGLHVTVFAALAGGLAAALARRSVRLTSRVPARAVGATVGVLAAGGYVLLAGAQIPALRTFGMLLIAACGLWWGRPGTAALVWLWALAGVLVFDPFASLTPGFWLSYGAVALLLYASTGRLSEAAARPAAGWRQKCASVLRESAHAQWVVTLGLAPLTLALFGQMSLVAPLANALAIPLVTLLVVPLSLAGILLPVDALFVAAHAAFAPLMGFLEFLSALPDAAWQQHAPPLWAVVAAMAGTLWILAPRGVPGRGWGYFWLLPLFMARPPPLAEGALRMTVLDAGQGLAVVLATRQATFVYDTGPRFNDTADAGNRIVAPFLRAAGHRRVDGLIVSHQDLDHAGGASALLDAVPVGWFASSLPATHPLAVRAAATTRVISCAAGQQWSADGVHFTVLHPTALEYADALARTNDRSCVVRVDTASGSVLLTGDIEAVSEARLIRTQALSLRADVVVVPHHGSRTSSTLAFVRAAKPRYAVVTSGYRNRFGHPRSDVVARWSTAGAQVLRTDEAGALTFEFMPSGLRPPGAARTVARRYWHAVPQEPSAQ